MTNIAILSRIAAGLLSNSCHDLHPSAALKIFAVDGRHTCGLYEQNLEPVGEHTPGAAHTGNEIRLRGRGTAFLDRAYKSCERFGKVVYEYL